jgi:hypothetical protein
MDTLCTGKRRGNDHGSGIPRLHLDLHPLVAQELYAGAPMNSPTSIMPEERLTPNHERMQEDAHLARLRRGAAIPLTLLAERTGAAPANASRIHHAQAPIGFSTPFLGG